ncbi:unnamed protein product [Cercopithifilaria johnstoni]|uniref:RYYR-CCHC domain-containing protein n=1 Tax=Cercopithifilaria johnstoni TaxID=2874296 RepID=A0A8J2MGY4_9BILA|nr:unnamed protein product [Cercopithifilaria johnstoni]
MEMKSTYPTQRISVDAQHAVPQTSQRMVMGGMQQECTDGMEEQKACLAAQDTNQAFSSATVAECQAVCSKSTEANVSNQADGEGLNVQDSQEPGTTWQDDEHEYEAQMNLLNEEWRKPEVDEIMTKLLKGELSFAEAAGRISIILGREVTVASVRNRALRCSDLPHSGQSNIRKEREEGGENRENTLEKHPVAAKKFGPEFYEVIRNLRGNLNSIAIKEPHSNYVRIYRRSTTRHYYSYYRCSTCDHIRREVQDCHPSPIIKMVHDNIVGEPFPSHHPECKPISPSQLRAMQIDRENRQEVINEMMTPFEAWSKGDLRALLEEARRVSQLARQRPQWKKVKCKSRNENERCPYARPYGETLVSYEEKIRKKLSEQIKRPDSRSSSAISERFGAQIRSPTGDEWSFARQGQNDRSFVTDDSQSLISEVTDADRLLSEEKVHIEQSKISAEGTPELNITGKFSFASRDSGEPVNDFGGTNQIILGDRTSTSETGAESGTTVTSAGMPKACSAKDRSNKVTMSTDDGKQDIIRETNRKMFMVDDEHLLKLFRRCPDCGEQLKTLALSSRKAIPMVKYKCQGSCEEKLWFGHEPKQ